MQVDSMYWLIHFLVKDTLEHFSLDKIKLTKQ